MSMDKILAKLRNYFDEFEFGLFDDRREKPAAWPVEARAKNLRYLQAQNAERLHVFIRPSFEREPYFMLVDDLNSDQLNQHKLKDGSWKQGRLVVMTSPGNYQVWVHADRPLSNEEKAYWLKLMHCDPGAVPKHRWGRSPGFRNHKYQDGPLSRLVWVDWTGPAKIPNPGKAFQKQTPVFSAKRPKPTGGGDRPADLISRSDYATGDESQTDFRYALALIRRGATADEIKARILAERTDWKHHKGSEVKYIDRTLTKAYQVAGVAA